MRHLLEEGLDPGTRFRGIQPVETMTNDYQVLVNYVPEVR